MPRYAVYFLAALIALSSGLLLSRYWTETSVAPGPAGAEIVDIPVLALDGTMHTLREWNEGPLLVNFWATWCAPCVAEMPAIQSVWQAYKDRGLEVVGLAIDEADAVVEFRERLGIEYPLVLAVDDPVDMLTRFGDHSGALPYTAVLDASGQIVETHTGPLTEEQLKALVNQHLSP